MSTSPELTIAVLTDLHLGGPEGGGFQNRFLTTDATRLIGPTFDAINRATPDLVLISGDLTQDATPDQLAQIDSCLQGLNPPVIVCKGNHDRETPEAAARFDAVLNGRATPGVTPASALGLSNDVAILVLECSWRKDGHAYASEDPPLAIVDDGLVETALADLDRIRPGLLLVVCHYPLVSQANYVRSVNGQYAGHVDGGEELLQKLTRRAGAVVCFTGHNHYHHITSDGRWLQCGTGALAEYPAEFRTARISGDQVTISTSGAAQDVLAEAPAPEHLWVAGEPAHREITWRPE